MSGQTSTAAKRIRSIGITVSDADRISAFYTQALGFELVADTTLTDPNYSKLMGVPDAAIRIMALKLGDEQVELMQYLNHPGEPIPADSQSNDLWFQHLAIVVSDMDRAYAQLKPFLTETISDQPQTVPASNEAAAGVRAFKFKDPDRHSLELIWFPSDKGQEKWHQQTDKLFLGIDHSAICIADTDSSLQFYEELLGMQVDGGSLNEGKTQAHLDGLPEAKVRVTALRPAEGGLGIELLDYLIPVNGRPMPDGWKSCDIAYMQIEMIIQNIEEIVEQLRQNQVQFVSQHPLQMLSSDSHELSGCLVKGPSGHAILLIGD